MHLFFDELDDEDGVLGRQAHRGEEADLEIDVIGQVPHGGGHDGAEHTERQHQQVHKRNGPALVQRRHAQEYHQDGKGVQDWPLSGGHSLLIGETVPVKPNPLRQLGNQVFHRLHGLARTAARCRLTPNIERGEPIKPFQPRGTACPARGRKRRERHHLAIRTAHVEFFQIRWQHPVRRVRLRVHALDAAGQDKVVHIGTAERRSDGVVNRRNGHSERTGFFPVHINPVLRHVFHAVGTNVRQPGIFGD